jgi:hypothetical protein
MTVHNHLLDAAGYENHRLRNIVRYIDETEADGSWMFDTRYLDV